MKIIEKLLDKPNEAHCITVAEAKSLIKYIDEAEGRDGVLKEFRTPFKGLYYTRYILHLHETPYVERIAQGDYINLQIPQNGDSCIVELYRQPNKVCSGSEIEAEIKERNKVTEEEEITWADVKSELKEWIWELAKFLVEPLTIILCLMWAWNTVMPKFNLPQLSFIDAVALIIIAITLFPRTKTAKKEKK